MIQQTTPQKLRQLGKLPLRERREELTLDLRDLLVKLALQVTPPVGRLDDDFATVLWVWSPGNQARTLESLDAVARDRPRCEKKRRLQQVTWGHRP